MLIDSDESAVSVCSNNNPYSEATHELGDLFSEVYPQDEDDIQVKGYLDLRLDKQTTGIYIRLNSALSNVRYFVIIIIDHHHY